MRYGMPRKEPKIRATRNTDHLTAEWLDHDSASYEESLAQTAMLGGWCPINLQQEGCPYRDGAHAWGGVEQECS